MTSIVTKSSIIDDLGVRHPPLVCLFSVQNITEKIKTLRSRHLHFKVKRKALEQSVKFIQKHQLKHQNSANFVLLVSLMLTLNIIYTLFQFFYFNYEQVNAERHMLHLLSFIQKQSPTGVFQERCSTNNLESLQENIHAKV